MYPQPQTIWRWLITLLLLLFVCVPATNITWFDGLPLSPYESLGFIIILVIIWGSDLFTQRPFRLFWSISLLGLILWQLIGAAFIPTGWSICLQRELEKPSLTTTCELSAQSNSGLYTLTTPRLNYIGRNFPLYFMNEAPFNYTNEEEPNRHDMPYNFSASAFFHPSQATNLTITTNTPNTWVDINGQAQPVIIDEPLSVSLDAQQSTQVTIKFLTARSDSDAIAVQTDAQPFYSTSAHYPADWLILIYQVIFSLLFLVTIFLSCFALFKMYLSFNKTQRNFLVYALALSTISLLWPQSNAALFIVILLGLSALFVAGHLPHTKFKYLFIILILFQAFSFTSTLHPAGELQLLEGGDDTLNHEDQARQVMKSSTGREFLTAGQTGVFYYQPLYRYLLGTIHKMIGESLWAAAFIQTFLLSLVVLVSMQTVFTIGRHPAAAFLSVLLFMVFAVFENTPLKLAQSTYQEALGLPLFMLAILLTIQAWSRSWTRPHQYFLISLLWGLTISVRTNLTPTLAAWLIWAVSSLVITPTRRRRIVLALSSLLGLAVFPALVVIRNIFTASRVQFLTSSLHPNLIDPFRPLFPNLGGASDLTFLTVITTLHQAYQGRWSELVYILWHNMSTYYIGLTLPTQIGWGIAYLLLAYGLIRLAVKDKIIIAIMFVCAAFPMLFGAFFLHRNIAVISQVNLLLALILSISVALLISSTADHSTPKKESA